MAKGRMINRTLSQSKKFNLKLSDDFTRLLYCLLLPYADRDGRIEGEPVYLRSVIFPWREDVTVQKIEAALQDLDKSGLINWYTVAGEKYIQITKFTEGQAGMRYEREPESEIPPVPEETQQPCALLPEESRQEAGNKPAEGRQESAPVQAEKEIEKEIEKEGEYINNTYISKPLLGEENSPPYFLIPVEFHKRRNERLGLTCLPTEEEKLLSKDLLQGIGDLKLITQCLDAFFDDSQDWYFTRKSKIEPGKRVYHFKTFCKVCASDLVPYVRDKVKEEEKSAFKKEREKVRASPPLKCPKCGKRMIQGTPDTVGCKKCKVLYQYDTGNNRWESVA